MKTGEQPTRAACIDSVSTHPSGAVGSRTGWARVERQTLQHTDKKPQPGSVGHQGLARESAWKC